MENKKQTCNQCQDDMMARRYADGRKTYAPDMFNRAYDALRKVFTEEELDKHADDVVKSFPYASEDKF